MKLARVAAIAGVGVCAFASRSGAQTCLGNASFASGVVRLGASVSFSHGSRFFSGPSGPFTDPSTPYGGELAAGAPHFVFGAVDVGSISQSASIGGGTSSVMGATLGFDVAAGSRASFCPMINHTNISFPHGPLSNERDDGLGAAFGERVAVAPDVEVVPYVVADYFYSWLSSRQLYPGVFTGGQGGDKNGATVSAGVGLVMNQAITFRPSVTVPLGVAGERGTFSMSVSFNFGHKVEAR